MNEDWEGYINKRKEGVGSSHLLNEYLSTENEEAISSQSTHSQHTAWDVTFVTKT